MSKRAGAVSAETRARLMQAAADEFSACGFQHSSLRRICQEAGVTTGALYFFFDGKDDLFRAVISQVEVPFMEFIRGHYQSEQEGNKDPKTAEADDLEISRVLLDFYYQNRQGCDILLHHRDHPAVQSFMESFVDYTADHYTRVLEKSAGDHPADPYAVRWFARMQLDTMLGLISHDFTREEAIEHAKTVTRMLRGAFAVLLAK